MKLRTEADVVRALAGRAVTMDELYEACEQAGVTARDGGEEPVPTHPNDRVWRRRVRNALQSLKRAGKAERVGRGVWVIDGTRDEPRRSLLVLVAGEPGPLELAVEEAAAFLQRTDEPFDLIVADPPYGIYGDDHAGDIERRYARDSSLVVPGYVEVDGDYGEFTHRWVAAAADVLRPGAHLVVVTSTEVAWRVGHVAHDLGLVQVAMMAVERRFALRSTRRPAHAHWVATVLTNTVLLDPARYFAPQLEDHAPSGAVYPLDVWIGAQAPPKAERRRAYRYRNALPAEMVDRLVRTYTPGPEVGADPWTARVADPFLGSGTTAVACLRRQRRFAGCDLNPEALRFTMARISREEAATHRQTGPDVEPRQLTLV